MKKLTLILVLFAALFIKANAQIPNFGFESWYSYASALEPTSWSSSNLYDTIGTYYAITRSTDHCPPMSGLYSIRLESNNLMLPSWHAYGIAWTGSNSDPSKPSFSLNGTHPVSFCGYYKYFPQNSDTVFIALKLFLNGVAVDSVKKSDTMPAHNWTPFAISIPAYADADSATVIIASYNAAKKSNKPHGNSVLLVDNLTFDILWTSTGDIKDKSSAFALYPNPASGLVTVEFLKKNSSNLTLNILNMTGDRVKTLTLNKDQQVFDVSDLSAGTYFVEVRGEELLGVQKLIVQR